MKISIIGQGYVGLTVALFASKTHEVVGFDLNESLVKQLNQGISHVEGLPNSMLQEALKSKRYRARGSWRTLPSLEVPEVCAQVCRNRLQRGRGTTPYRPPSSKGRVNERPCCARLRRLSIDKVFTARP